MDITAKRQGSDAITVNADIPLDLKGKVEKYGDAVTNAHATASLKQFFQDVVRAGIDAGEDQKAIQKRVNAAVPGEKKRGKSASEKQLDAFDKLSEEDKTAVLAALQEKAAA